jgi:hypothetical protein
MQGVNFNVFVFKDSDRCQSCRVLGDNCLIFILFAFLEKKSLFLQMTICIESLFSTDFQHC